MRQGVKAVIAKSFERIHRSNLVGMGIIPLCFKAGEDADTLGLTGHERYTIDLPSNISEIKPGQDVTVATDSGKSFTCTVRFDTEVFPSFLYFAKTLASLLTVLFGCKAINHIFQGHFIIYFGCISRWNWPTSTMEVFFHMS